jgi:UDP-N-acetylmuramyl pentapeptide phosphotransferase/UDP-N-acetylglucosamine-1-phosphate transferase
MKEKFAKEGYESSVLLVLLATILVTGINGLVAFLFFAFFSSIKYGRDPKLKHGLSPGKSRLGGVAIIISIMIGCCSHVFFNTDFNINLLFSEFDHIFAISIIIGVIGLIEDLNQNTSSKARLVWMMIIVSIFFVFVPALIPSNFFLLSYLYSNNLEILAFLFTTVMVTGFINAGNIADGANGLLTSIFFFFFLIAYSLDNTVFNFSVLITLLAFIIFNVSTGKIFLGDFGSYSLSSLVALKSLEFYLEMNVSLFFWASVLIYPCFEIARSLLIRSIRKMELMKPDNNHLHNHINTFILGLGFSKHTSNSITGLGIALTSSIIPIILYFSGTSLDSNMWRIFFLIQLITLSLIYIFFEKKFSR